MSHSLSVLLLAGAVGTVVLFAADGLAQLPASGERVVILSARQLAELPDKGVELPAPGPWHARAWQAGGKAVRWTLCGQKLPPATADAEAGAFGWAKLGPVAVEGGRLTASFTPRPGRKPGPVAALLLTRDADADPARLWALSRVRPGEPSAAPDPRPDRCRHLNMRFTMPDYASRSAWERRAEWLREHVRVSCGLLPGPAKCDLNPHRAGRIEHDDYTVEKVRLESYPGWYITGNLYRPRGKEGPFPAVASPHGHARRGRLNHEPKRSSVVGRCQTLARMGFVVFAWDMLGWHDSGRQVKHRGVFTTRRDELWGLSAMHLQTWNSIRVLDYLQSLEEVDGSRIAVTGASGGGTQTFMVMGIDPRVTVAAPVCMISGIMQGGCECENAPLLRIETCNIEIAALMAPRPLIMPSVTGDWTKETMKHEYPSIRGVYELYDAADRVATKHIRGPHGYHLSQREAVYGFFNKWANEAETAKPVKEGDVILEKDEDLLFGSLPKKAITPDQLREHVAATAAERVDRLLPRTPADRERFAETLGAAYRHAILAERPTVKQLDVRELGREKVGNLRVTRLLLGRVGKGEAVPAVLYRRAGAGGKADGCVVVHPEGKAGLVDAGRGGPGELLSALLDGGGSVLALDAYLTGEFHSPFDRTEQRRDKKYFTTYNRTVLVQRVQDILTAEAYLKSRRTVSDVAVVGVGNAGAWCLLAAPRLHADTAVVADMNGLAGPGDPRWEADLFSPCLLRAGDVRTAVALTAPRKLLLHAAGESADARVLRAVYRSAGEAGDLRVESRPVGAKAVANWLGG